MQINVVGLDISPSRSFRSTPPISGQPVAQVRLGPAQVVDHFRLLPPCLVGMEAAQLCTIGHAS
jgi:hypothetical protein